MTPLGKKATTAPYGSIDRPFDACKLAEAAGATYVARSTAFHVQHLVKMIEEGMDNKGFSFIEALVQCPTAYGRRNKIGDPAKMMEWINTPKKLSPAYLDSNMYFYSDVSLDFIEFFRSLVDEQKKPASDGRLIRKNKRYDAIQMAIHILAIYNYCRENKTAVPKKVSLQNVVWAHGCDDYDKEQSEGKEFVEKANNTFSPIFEKLGIDFSVEYVTFQDFKARIDFTNDKDREAYLTRYEI